MMVEQEIVVFLILSGGLFSLVPIIVSIVFPQMIYVHIHSSLSIQGFQRQ
jgi:hypothetical protein